VPRSTVAQLWPNDYEFGNKRCGDATMGRDAKSMELAKTKADYAWEVTKAEPALTMMVVVAPVAIDDPCPPIEDWTKSLVRNYL
jgi:hypothetical protein